MKEIDLGLSVKWSDCNLGASKPEEQGHYYQWGGTIEITETNCRSFWDNAPHQDPKDWKWKKYNEKDGLVTLDSSDDIVNITLGEGYHIPTHQEWEELKEKCTWSCETLNGVRGLRVTSTINGNSIFLPAEGYLGLDGWRIYGKNVFGSYWSSSLDLRDSSRADSILFTYAGLVESTREKRGTASSIRPVRDK